MFKLSSFKIYLFRNRRLRNFNFYKRKINLLYYKFLNVGDCLSPVVFSFMLNRMNITLESSTKHKYQKISCIGSIIQNYYCDMTIWGSGLIRKTNFEKGKKLLQKFDIRAVRGPLTLENLREENFTNLEKCVFGDPAILMPLIYKPEKITKRYEVSFIPHYSKMNVKKHGFHIIDVRTQNYRFFIDEILSSNLVISSSLHGIILSETYGVPCIWLKTDLDDFKFYDYYFSTGRKNIIFCKDISQALQTQPNDLPNLNELRDNLVKSFPYDLWK